ncbi:butyrophilin subfamily 2 member A1-like isoform X1 [Oreochromis aureus]|uniref:Ig-like domain-containing protein n=1 Tax=Oreochromis aureus TaxID=47969 RepID=A0A668SXU8_OREAU|nr:butyrophilin subfamily 2 member A1-like isoform X1 [Oreochromis aureus]
MEQVNRVRVLFHSLLLTCGSGRLFFCASATHVLVFLLAAVLSSCRGIMLVETGPKIVAFVGETILLPCITTINSEVPTVEWTKEGLFPNTAFLYRDGCETFEMKNPVFQYRTNLIVHKLHDGNLSMVISNVQLNDSGNYQCAIRRNRKKKIITRLELFVGAVSEPKLSVVPGVGGGLTLQCEARCWFPEPTITFLDSHGNEISAEDPKRDGNSPGCLAVTRRVTLHTATNRVTCRVQQPEINQIRDSEIYIPDEYLRSCTVNVVISIAVTILLVTITCALVYFIVKRCCSSVGGQKLSVNGVSINQLPKEMNESTPSPDTPPSESSNDSTSSPGISNPSNSSTQESPQRNNNLKPETSTSRSRPNSDRLSQTTGGDSEPAGSTQNAVASSQTQRSSQDSNSALSANSDNVFSNSPSHSKELHFVSNARCGSTARPQRRHTHSPDAEPLICI